MDSSQFSDSRPHFDSLERMETQGATCDTFCVKLYGKLHFLKRLKAECAGDIRYQEALRKEFETGYQLEHPHLVRYLSLDGDSILMEYVDGETLSQRLANNPPYFKNRKNTQKFVLQLLDVVGYLHRHQVLHLDLKPDNILLTRINDDVKLIDLGCCYTDAFQDTTGHTNAFAAPEQLSTVNYQLSTKTDIYAIGRILETLPDHTIYNKVIARCTAPNPIDRYQSVEEIQHAIRRRPLYFHWVAAFSAALVIAAVILALSSRQQEPAPAIMPETPIDSVAHERQDTIPHPKDTIKLTAPTPVKTTRPQSSAQQLKTDTDRMMEKAYQSTIATFGDSVFPSPTTGKAWSDASTEFHHQTTQIGNRLVEKYPNIPESTIRQDVESRFQNLVAYVFNKMRENGQNRQ